MIGLWDNYEKPIEHYCDKCGRKMSITHGTQEGFYYCDHGRRVGTMPLAFMPSYNENHQDLTQQQKNKIALIELNNQKIKQAWKRDQYAKVKGQYRI